MATIAELFTLGLSHHQSGNLRQAQDLYGQVLEAEPNHAEAWHYLGLLAHQAGQQETALEFMRRSLALDASRAACHGNLGTVYMAAGRLSEAVACQQQALRLQPEMAETHNNLANALKEQGRTREAVEHYRQALRLNPAYAEACNNLGTLLKKEGNLHEALRCYAQALRLNPSYAAAHTNQGAALMEQGKLAEAIACHQRALRLQPGLIEAHSNLGNALLAQGRPREAATSFQEVLRLKPDFAEACSDLGNALKAQGKPAEALASYQKALQLQPDLAAAHHNLGLLLQEQGRLAEAETCFRKVLRQQPSSAAAHLNLGNVLNTLGRFDEALACFQEALRLHPDSAQTHYSLGNAFLERNEVSQAQACYGQALCLLPDFPEAHLNLGNTLMREGKLEQAVTSFREALRLKPDLALAHNNLGVALMQQGKLEEAAASHRQALQLQPDLAQAHACLGNVLRNQGKLDEALACYRQALRHDFDETSAPLKPDGVLAHNNPAVLGQFAEAHNNMGVALLEQGKLAEAETCYREALRLLPDYPVARSNLLFCLNYDPKADPAQVYEEHCRWGELHGKPACSIPPHVNDPVPERRLKIGYVSPDFRNHAVARCFEPILANHDATQVETVCYAEVLTADATTAHLQALAHGWRSTIGLSDVQVAEMVRKDRIDILVDLAGHSALHRLSMFAYQPAPVQVTYLGYPNTTGLTSIDYRLTDAVLDPNPPDTSPHDGGDVGGGRYTEKLVHLHDGLCCFTPPRDAPEITPLPILQKGHITFGSLHNLAKLNEQVFDLWCQVLKAVPSAQLLVYRNTLTGQTREHVRQQFIDRGIAADRLELRHQATNYLEVYADIDLSLDVFPWTGHVISCEALWMGVPVLTLRGSRPASRLTSSVLTRLGLTDWIAETPTRYVALARQWAEDLEELTRLRFGMRGLMTARLCDGQKFTRTLEGVYRAMWRQWCARQTAR